MTRSSEISSKVGILQSSGAALSGQGQQPKATLAPAPSNSVAQARLREALTAGGPGTKEKGPPVADGFLSVTPDTPEAIEFRSRRSIFDSVGASSSYLEDETGPKPSELYGKFTWRIENFSEIGKRELRSTIFEVGSYKWYILVYPQGCDVCNHLSLFLCVADYDKLLPGWSHFAQFTIAVVNKDPKKSKYSDTLHRFCKKEHDWGWKKFMELNKVLEGFTVNNTLVIKAQVQVIRDRPSTPFRCLDAQYRRELVRVYLTNVETICRKFVDEKRESLAKLREDASGFRLFLGSLDPRKRRALATEKGEGILKGVVKRFFNEKEVTSTLVMDALFSGCKQLEEYGRMADSKKGKKERPSVVIHADKHVFALTGDILALLDRAATETIPPFRDDKASDQLALRNAQDVDDYSKDYVERDERRLADLGRRAVEMYAVSQVFADLQAAHSEAESIKLQDALIKEEEEAERMEDQRQAARLAVERERKARKKERRRAKKESDAATEAEKKQEEEEQARLVQEAAARHRKEEKAAQQPRQAASAAASHSSPPAVADARKSQQPSEAPTRQASAASIPDNAAAAARFSEAETTGRSLGAEDEPSRNSRRAANSLATARSSADISDDDSSTTSRSGNDEKPTVSTQQFEAHIEYLKGELARATSQLNASRTELAASKDALAEAHTEVEQLRAELTLAKAELASRPAVPHRDSDRSVAAPSAPSVASSYSALNAVEVNSMVSSTENETPSRAGSLDLTADTASARGIGMQDLLEAHPSGDIGNGAPPPPPHSRRPAWGGAPGPAHQELHASAAHVGPQHYNHIAHAQPQQAQLGTPSKSGTLSSVRQPPPPPPPAEPRAGPTLRAGSMPRQASIGLPLKESASAAPRQQSRGPVQQQSPGIRPGNGVHAGPKRSGAAHELHGVSRLGNKAKTSLNGNAPSFVPGTPSAPQQPAAANGGHVPNGHHAVSYRNAAAGLLTASSGETSDQNGAAAGSQVQVPSGKAVKPPASMAISKPRGGLAGHNSSMPATPRSVELGSSPVPGPLHMMNGSADGSFSPTTYGMASQPQHSMPFSSPIQPKKSEPNGPADSPGLDDFAHMGLINDLLE